MAKGQGSGSSPRKMCKSDPQIPAIRSFSAAVPGAGVDNGNSASSMGPPWAVRSASLGMIVPSARRCQNQPTGRHSGARGDQHVLDIVHLVVRRPADLAHALGDPVHAVDVCLTEQPAVGVDREFATERKPLDGREILGFAPPAETEFLELCEDERREMVIDEGGLDVLWF